MSDANLLVCMIWHPSVYVYRQKRTLLIDLWRQTLGVETIEAGDVYGYCVLGIY